MEKEYCITFELDGVKHCHIIKEDDLVQDLEMSDDYWFHIVYRKRVVDCQLWWDSVPKVVVFEHGGTEEIANAAFEIFTVKQTTKYTKSELMEKYGIDNGSNKTNRMIVGKLILVSYNEEQYLKEGIDISSMSLEQFIDFALNDEVGCMTVNIRECDEKGHIFGLTPYSSDASKVWWVSYDSYLEKYYRLEELRKMCFAD